jgi:hypothetical protein
MNATTDKASGLARHLGALLAYLAQAKPLDDDGPNLYLRIRGDRVPWTPQKGCEAARKVIRALDAALAKAKIPSPPSLREGVERCGPMQLRSSLIELASRVAVGGPLPVDDIFSALMRTRFKFEFHEDMVFKLQRDHFRSESSLGIGYVHVGQARARGPVWSRNWNDPWLLAATDLMRGTELTWLAYDAVAREPQAPAHSVPSVLPLALDFDVLLALHLTGLYPMFRAKEKDFERLIRLLASTHVKNMRDAVYATLEGVARAAVACRDRNDVRVPNVKRANEFALVATLGSVRGAEFFASDPGCRRWIGVTFVAAYLKQERKAMQLMKTVTKLNAPARAQEVMKNVVTALGGHNAGIEPYFVEGVPAEIAEHLRRMGFPVIVPDEYGDVQDFSSLVEGAVHVRERVKRMQGVL